ncbi:MAG: hypothetical protein LBF09_02625 [Odoribacteraceae bacterium]|jgi:hypothetical protein|nr:hypothetical protein [Odoribacteraceae bacterium]
MKTTINTLLLAAMFLSLASCQREWSLERSKAAGEFTLTLSVADADATRSSIPLEAGEDQVNSLHVLFFEESGDGSGKFLGYYEARNADDDDPDNDDLHGLLDPPLSSREQVRVAFGDITVVKDPHDQGQTFIPDADYSLLVVANIGEYIGARDVDDWIAAMIGKRESEVLDGAFLVINGASDETDDTRVIQPTNLPMNARVKRLARQEEVSVELRRSVFRISVINEAVGYELVSASLWNVYPRTPAWENVMNLFDLPLLKRFYGVPATGNEITAGLYAFENLSAVNEKNDERTTCLVLGLEHDGQVHYYRVNLNIVAGIGQQLARNGAYRLRIKNVGGPGEASEIDAYTAANFLLDVTVNEWNVDEQGTLLSDGDNVLAVPTNDIVFTPAAEERAYSVYTRGTATLELARVILPEGITATLEGHTLVVTVTATTEAREGYVELRLGTLKALVNIHQRPASETFLDLSRYDLPPFPGNGVYQMEGNVRVTSSGPWSAKIYGEGFTFHYRSSGLASTELYHRASGEGFTITTTGTNPNPDDSRHAFVSVFLDDDHEVHQVIVISQDAPVNFTINPPISPTEQIRFDALGTLVMGREKYEVDPGGSGLEWEAVSSNPRFKVSYYDETGTQLPEGATYHAGKGYFSVTATGVNTVNTVSTGIVDVYLRTAPAAKQTISVSQGVFTLSIYSAGGAVPSAGGEQQVSVTLSPAWSGSEWSASVHTSTAGHQAYFGIPGETTATGAINTPIVVTFPQSPIEFARVTPVATIEVSIVGTTGFSRSISFEQSTWPWRPLIIQSRATGGYGSMSYNASNSLYFDAFMANMRATTSFSPSGFVPTAGNLTFTTGETVASTATVYNANVYSISAAARTAVKTWMGTHHANFLVVIDDDVNSPSDRLALLNLFSPTFTTGAPSGSALRYITEPPGEGTAARRLWDYIFINGPFGTVGNFYISFATDNIDRALYSWPSTTVPILMHGDSRYPEVAIDPVLRILYIGDLDIFAYYRDSFTVGGDKWKVVNNLISFLVNAAQYGDPFLNMFR